MAGRLGEIVRTVTILPKMAPVMIDIGQLQKVLLAGILDTY
jgi:hypothetical protein